ncbi:N-acetylglutamate synthase [Labedella gwakjiensis]|uniref:Amino-acid N-acetyltransferase n=1 Tax=Labedella gwakjiensis TaxID=390269 RepID=A0A2P8GSA3_9MICO|nr:amino-acid N-acetyltransferase [Labedella gwakjiensis]PSL36841.1 N-acetylglutamate synthase [Labedella gwakjiensis]RUQ84345.1 amino-acid N-acetyltransferase [Labedella gwakjiensis]
MGSPFTVRRARASDVPAIEQLVAPYVQRRILIGKERVAYYESIQEFQVAEGPDGILVGCGALHTLWEDLGEVRTLAVSADWLHHGVGHAILEELQNAATSLGLKRLFCLTFEVDFFEGHGFRPIGETVVPPEVYAELVRSSDEGVAEFLELARVKPNTLGNTRMLKLLDPAPATAASGAEAPSAEASSAD